MPEHNYNVFKNNIQCMIIPSSNINLNNQKHKNHVIIFIINSINKIM